MTPLGAEWGMVTVTEDLMELSRDLAQLAWDYRQEARGWTHRELRESLEDRATTLTSWAQQAALESTRGDYCTRYAALQQAIGQREAARISLRHIFEAGELWNSHRIRPVPASIREGNE